MRFRFSSLTILALTAALLSAGCGDSSTGSDTGGTADPSTITLSLRVHVLSSAEARLNATSSDDEIRAMLVRVN